MRLSLLILFIFITSLSQAQTYSISDINVLKSIKAQCDKNNTLNWADNVSPDQWTRTLWSFNGVNYRVVWIDIDNLKLTGSMNINGLDSLRNLSCMDNQLTSLTVTGSPKLTVIECYNNQLKSLTLSSLPKLDYLSCNNNKLTSLDVLALKELKKLYCSQNNLSSLDISNLSKLELLYCSQNNLTSLNISGLPNLVNFGCKENQLISLDVSKLLKLKTLECGKNRLPISSLKTALSIKDITTWGYSFLYSNQDSIHANLHLNIGDKVDYSLEDSVNTTPTKFQWFRNYNFSKSSDIISNGSTFTFNNSGIYYCRMSNPALPNAFPITKTITVDKLTPTVTWPSLSNIVYGDSLKSSNFSGESGDGIFSFTQPNRTFPSTGTYKVELLFTPNDPSKYRILKDTFNVMVTTRYSAKDIAILRKIENDNDSDGILGWKNESDFSKWKHVDWKKYGNEYKVDSLSIKSLNLEGSLDLRGLDSLNYVMCDTNKVSSINASNLKKLKYLYCNYNQITNLDLSNSHNIEVITALDNKITSLDFFNLIKLKYIDLKNNQISNIDVSGLTNLTNLNLSGNNLPFSSLKTALTVKNISAWSQLLIYSPQDSLFENLNLEKGDSIDYSLQESINSTKTIFTWYRNDTLVTGSEVISKEAVFIFNKEGMYHCQMKNPELPNSTLYTKSIQVSQPQLNITWPSLSDIIFGENLQSATMSGGIGTGVFSFPNPDSIISSSGIHYVDVNFTPTNTTNGNHFTKSLQIKVKKAIPIIDILPTASPIESNENLSLSYLDGGEVNVSGYFQFKDGDKLLDVGMHNVIVEFVPDNLIDYVKTEISIKIIVNKITPTISWPTLSDISYGDSLKSASVNGQVGNGVFSFINPDSTFSEAGTYQVEYAFMPSDTTKYRVLKESLNLNVLPVYSAKDISILTKIAKNNDQKKQLNWESESNYDSWMGVYWEAHGNEYRANNLTIPDYDLIGTLDLNGLDLLQSLNCSNNNISYLDVSSLTNLEELNCSNNRLKYSSLVTALQIKSIDNWGNMFQYSGQDNLFSEQNLKIGESVDYSSESMVLSTTSLYTWYKNGSIISNNDISIDNFVYTFNESGIYHCEITNSILRNQIFLTKLINVRKEKSVISNMPSATNIIFNNELNTSKLIGGKASTTGIFTFKNGNKLLNVGTHTVAIEFLPSDIIKYEKIDTTLTITVEKAIPSVTFPKLITIKHGEKLSKSILSDSRFKFKNPNQIMIAGEHLVEVIYYPTDSANYSSITNNIKIQVSKLDQNIIWDQILSEVEVGEVLNILAVSNASLKIDLEISPSDAFSIDNTKLTAKKAYDSVIVTIKQTGNSIYNAAKPVSKIIKIKESVLSRPKLLEIKIYPNPTSGSLHLEGAKKGSMVKLLDIKGRKLLQHKVSKNVEKLDVSRFNRGIYILECHGYYFRIQIK